MDDNGIDRVDQQILEALTQDARLSLKALAAHVAMSAPSVTERLRRLEERGVIRAYTLQINPMALGYTLEAIVRIRPMPGQVQRVQALLQQMPEICECDKVTGDDCFIARLFVRDIAQLDALLDRIADKAETSTSIVKTKPIARRLPPLNAREG